MLNQFSYRFTPYRAGMDPKRAEQGKVVRIQNDTCVDRLKTDFDLKEDSTIGDLRREVGKLTDV